MAEDLGKAVLTLEADGGHFSRSLSTARGEASGFVSAMGAGFMKVGKIALLAAGAAGIGAISVALAGGIKEWVQSAKVAAQTAAVIKSTGGAANVTAKEVDALAQSIMNKSGIDDEAIKSGENMLLTFSSIRNEVGAGNNIFDQATQAVTDMDVAMTHGNSTQESLSKTAILVGKALNDPIKGATALRRVGVQLTDAQTKQIAAFVKSGDTMKAQKIIIAELTKEFGGSAKAMGDTLPGKINILRENFKNLAGTMVGSLAPAFSTVITGLTHFMQRLSAAHGFTAKIGVVFDVAKDAFNSVRKTINHLLFGGQAFGGGVGPQGIKIDKGMVDKVRDAFAKLDWSAVGKSIIDGVVKALKTAGELAKELAGMVMKSVRKVDWTAVGRMIGPGLATAVVVAFTTLLDPAFWAKNWDLALAVGLVAFGGVFGKIGGRLVALLARPFADAVLGLGVTLERISPRLATAVMSGLMQLPRLLGDFFAREGQNLEHIVTNLFGRLAGLATFTIKVLGVEVAIHELVAFATGPVWNTIRAAFTTLQGVATTTWNAITAGVRTFATTLTSAMTTAWTAVRTATTTALTALATAVTTAFTTMQAAVTRGMTAIGAAMTTAWGAIRGAAVTAWNFLVGTITGAVGRATTAATKVGRGILDGVKGGLAGLVGVVQAAFQALWGWIKGAAGSAFAFAFRIGSQIVQGILSGIGDIAKSLGDKLKSGVEKGLRAIDPRRLNPFSPVSHWAVMLAQELTKEVSSVERILGSSLTKALTAALRSSTKAAGDVGVKGMNSVGQMIVAAAKKFGVDAKAALAVAMTEGGIKKGAVGDSGTSFGPFQLHTGGELPAGMDPAKAAAFANSIQGINFALRRMAEEGAKGLTGLAAIKQIVGGPGWGFERPANAAAEVAKAFGYFKQLGPEVARSLASAGPMVSGQIGKLAALVAQWAPKIGLEHARGVVAGLVQGEPTMLQRAKAGMVAVAAAQRQAVVDAKGAFVSAFNDLANAALQAFDAKMAAWKPPSLRLLDKMQLQDQLKGVQDSLASAMATVQSGGAAMAADISKTLGPQLADAMATAFGQIAGAKTEAALNTVSQTAQAQVTAAITTATATATTAAQTAVDMARAALATAQAGGDPDAIAAAQQALDTAVANQITLEAAVRAEVETATGQLIIAEQTRHDQIAAKTREGMAKRLAQEKTDLLEDPKAWDKMGVDVQKILNDYNVKLQTAGHMWANKFGDGITAGIPAAVAAARALAAAVAAVLPSTASPLKPAKEGPLAFHPFHMGQQWTSAFAGGLAAGKIGSLIQGSLPVRMPTTAAPSGDAGGATTGPTVIQLILNQRVLAEATLPELRRITGRNVTLQLG